MTDNEIIKALECCLAKSLVDDKCEQCPYFVAGAYCMDKLFEDALDIIKRQQSTVDNLKNNIVPRLVNGLECADRYGAELEQENKDLREKIKMAEMLMVDEGLWDQWQEELRYGCNTDD
jgi:hypothetical protein